jgi:hypothetical protein
MSPGIAGRGVVDSQGGIVNITGMGVVNITGMGVVNITGMGVVNTAASPLTRCHLK